jgi:hypothetical protein
MERMGGIPCEENLAADDKTEYELLRDKRVAELAQAFEPVQRAASEL